MRRARNGSIVNKLLRLALSESPAAQLPASTHGVIGLTKSSCVGICLQRNLQPMLCARASDTPMVADMLAKEPDA